MKNEDFEKLKVGERVNIHFLSFDFLSEIPISSKLIGAQVVKTYNGNGQIQVLIDGSKNPVVVGKNRIYKIENEPIEKEKNTFTKEQRVLDILIDYKRSNLSLKKASEKIISIIYEPDYVLCDCSEIGSSGSCPYVQEISGEEKKCNCCESCRENCMSDI